MQVSAAHPHLPLAVLAAPLLQLLQPEAQAALITRLQAVLLTTRTGTREHESQGVGPREHGTREHESQGVGPRELEHGNTNHRQSDHKNWNTGTRITGSRVTGTGTHESRYF